MTARAQAGKFHPGRAKAERVYPEVTCAPQRCQPVEPPRCGRLLRVGQAPRSGGQRLGSCVALLDLFGSHRQLGLRRWHSRGEDVAQQPGHGVARIGGQRPVQRHVGERPVTGLPRGEGQQRGGCGQPRAARPAYDVSPQSQVRLPVPGDHPRPGVVPYRQADQADQEPGESVRVGDRAAAAVDPDRLAHRPPPGADRQP